MVPLLVLIVLLPLSSTETLAKSVNNCNDACQTKSYSITRDGFIGCSGVDNCLMEASFKANLINNQPVLNINIVGYDFASLKEATFSIVLAKGKTESKYSCSIVSYGATSAQVTSDGYSYVNGSSQVNQNNLYCSWYMVYDSDIWPQFGGIKATFQSDSNLKILFGVDSKKFAVSSNTVDLPIYRMQFLQCCYKIHGNQVYKLIVDQTDKQTNFFIETLDSNPSILSVTLTDQNGKQLVFDCYLTNSYMTGYLKTEALTDDISDQLIQTSFIRSIQCSWSLPLTVKGSFSTYDTKNGVYDLQILADSQIVFYESNVPLKSGALKILSSLLLVNFAFVISFLIY